MSDSAAQFHAALARVSAAQILRACGIDRTKATVVDAFADVLIRAITTLGKSARLAAEHAGRGRCDVEDARQAMEEMGIIRQEVLPFIQWCMSKETQELRRIAGEDDEMEGGRADWLQQLLDKQIKSNGIDRFNNTILGPAVETRAESFING